MIFCKCLEKILIRNLWKTWSANAGRWTLGVFCITVMRPFPKKIKQSKVPLRFRKVGRVWCGGSRETHWAMYRNSVTPSKTKEFLPAFLDLNGLLFKPFILCMYKDFTESGIFEYIWLYAYIIYLPFNILFVDKILKHGFSQVLWEYCETIVSIRVFFAAFNNWCSQKITAKIES